MKTGMLKTAAILAGGVVTAQHLHAQTPLAIAGLRGEVKSVYAFGESDWLKVWFDPAGRITMKVSQEGDGPTWLPGRRILRSIEYYTGENEE